MSEDEVGDGNVCEWFQESGDDPHPEQSCESERLCPSSLSVERALVGTVPDGCANPHLSPLLPFWATPAHPLQSHIISGSTKKKKKKKTAVRF